jgi:flotillin
VRERTIKVAQHLAESEKGKKQAEADQRVYVQKQETLAAIGEAEAMRDKEIKVAENDAESTKGQKKAEAEKRVFVQAQEAEAIAGENRSRALMAASNADLTVQAAQAAQRGQVAQFEAQAEIQKAQAKAELQRLTAAEVVKQQIEKQKITIAAEAEAEKIRREAQGHADATLLKYEAEAKGIKQVLEAKAQGYQALVQSAGNDARAAATLLLTEKLEQIVTLQVEAIKAIKIDKVTVWDSGTTTNGNGSTTANFLAGMVKSLPPLHDVAAMAGLELPKFLGDAKSPEVPAANGHGT